MKTLVTLFSLVISACFTPVSESECATDATCRVGARCVLGRCLDVGGGTVDGGRAGTCQGCTWFGQCLPGDWAVACGQGGSACLTCALGQQCIAGRCATTECGAASCAGCCSQGVCVPFSAQSPSTCGAWGSSCVSCERGQACRGGACIAAGCGPSSCPLGCCSNGQCLTGDDPHACGSRGTACRACPFGGTCTGGFCSVPADAGPGAAIGDACDSLDRACQPSAFCIPESGAAGPNGFPGGTCAAACGSDQRCPKGAVCVATSVVGVSTTVCMASCETAGGPSTCRKGYVCAPLPGGSNGWCRPSCLNENLASCPPGHACNPAVGLCED